MTALELMQFPMRADAVYHAYIEGFRSRGTFNPVISAVRRAGCVVFSRSLSNQLFTPQFGTQANAHFGATRSILIHDKLISVYTAFVSKTVS